MALTVSVSFVRVRRLYAHIIVHLAFLLCCQAVRVVIDDSNPRVVYNTPVLQESACKFQRGNADCDGHWWSETGDSRGAVNNNSVHTTYGPLTRAVLEFQGKSVTLYGVRLVQYGAKALITLDDDAPAHVDCNLTTLPNNATLETQQVLFSKSGLDPLAPHQITVAYDDSTFDPTNRAWMTIDYFELDEPPEGSSTTQIPSSPASGTTSGSSNGTGRSTVNVGAIVGGVLGGLAGVLLAIPAGLWLRRRRLRKGVEQMVSPLPIQAENPRSMPSAKTAGQSDASPSSIGAPATVAPASLPPPYSHNPVVAHMSRRVKG